MELKLAQSFSLTNSSAKGEFLEEFDREMQKIQYIQGRKVQIRISKDKEKMARGLFDGIGLKILVENTLAFEK